MLVVVLEKEKKQATARVGLREIESLLSRQSRGMGGKGSNKTVHRNREGEKIEKIIKKGQMTAPV